MDILYKNCRCICYDPVEGVYTEEGFIIENIYYEVLPIYIELFKRTEEDILTKDKFGNNVLLWVE